MTEQVEYVRGSESDNWHWCKNCSQYPFYILERRFHKPQSKLCPQCKAKEDNKDCRAQIEIANGQPDRGVDPIVNI